MQRKSSRWLKTLYIPGVNWWDEWSGMEKSLDLNLNCNPLLCGRILLKKHFLIFFSAVEVHAASRSARCGGQWFLLGVSLTAACRWHWIPLWLDSGAVYFLLPADIRPLGHCSTWLEDVWQAGYKAEDCVHSDVRLVSELIGWFFVLPTFCSFQATYNVTNKPHMVPLVNQITSTRRQPANNSLKRRWKKRDCVQHPQLHKNTHQMFDETPPEKHSISSLLEFYFSITKQSFLFIKSLHLICLNKPHLIWRYWEFIFSAVVIQKEFTAQCSISIIYCLILYYLIYLQNDAVLFVFCLPLFGVISTK